jgi:hypothetical protein
MMALASTLLNPRVCERLRFCATPIGAVYNAVVVSLRSIPEVGALFAIAGRPGVAGRGLMWRE